MEPKSVWIAFKRSISCLLMIALLCNLVIVADLYAADRTDGGEVALADAGITLERVS